MNNVFNFATSELSQDALLCYWFNFATKEHFNESIEERESAQVLLSNIINKHYGLNLLPKDIIVNKIVKQFNFIDILLLVNNKYFILIEDKTYTFEHEKQIDNYLTKLFEPNEKTKLFINNNFEINPTKKNTVPVYFKMIDQNKYEEDRYIKIIRNDILDILNEYNFKDLSILSMFKQHLLAIDDQVNNFEDYPFSAWSHNQYFGFFNSIKDKLRLKDDNFNIGYLNNKGGGFFAAWFNSEQIDFPDIDNIFIMISGPKEKNNNFTIEFRFLYRPLKIKNEESLFLNIEKIRNYVISQNNEFDRAYTPRSIPKEHLKKDNEIDRYESLRIAKSIINFKEYNEFISNINKSLTLFSDTVKEFK